MPLMVVVGSSSQSSSEKTLLVAWTRLEAELDCIQHMNFDSHT
jgi:hypothetical protein